MKHFMKFQISDWRRLGSFTEIDNSMLKSWTIFLTGIMSFNEIVIDSNSVVTDSLALLFRSLLLIGQKGF